MDGFPVLSMGSAPPGVLGSSLAPAQPHPSMPPPSPFNVHNQGPPFHQGAAAGVGYVQQAMIPGFEVLHVSGAGTGTGMQPQIQQEQLHTVQEQQPSEQQLHPTPSLEELQQRPMSAYQVQMLAERAERTRHKQLQEPSAPASSSGACPGPGSGGISMSTPHHGVPALQGPSYMGQSEPEGAHHQQKQQQHMQQQPMRYEQDGAHNGHLESMHASIREHHGGRTAVLPSLAPPPPPPPMSSSFPQQPVPQLSAERARGQHQHYHEGQTHYLMEQQQQHLHQSGPYMQAPRQHLPHGSGWGSDQVPQPPPPPPPRQHNDRGGAWQPQEQQHGEHMAPEQPQAVQHEGLEGASTSATAAQPMEVEQQAFNSMTEEQQATYMEQWHHFYQQQQYYQQHAQYYQQQGQYTQYGYPDSNQYYGAYPHQQEYNQMYTQQGYQQYPPAAYIGQHFVAGDVTAPQGQQHAGVGTAGATSTMCVPNSTIGVTGTVAGGAGIVPGVTTPTAGGGGRRIPDWLREEMLKRQAAGTAADGNGKEEQDLDEDAGAASAKDKRQFTETPSDGGRWGNTDTPKNLRTEEPDDSDEEEARTRQEVINREIKTNLTQILLEVTDVLFEELAREVYAETAPAKRSAVAGAVKLAEGASLGQSLGVEDEDDQGTGLANRPGTAQGSAEQVNAGGGATGLLGLGYGSDEEEGDGAAAVTTRETDARGPAPETEEAMATRAPAMPAGQDAAGGDLGDRSAEGGVVGKDEAAERSGRAGAEQQPAGQVAGAQAAVSLCVGAEEPCEQEGTSHAAAGVSPALHHKGQQVWLVKDGGVQVPAKVMVVIPGTGGSSTRYTLVAEGRKVTADASQILPKEEPLDLQVEGSVGGASSVPVEASKVLNEHLEIASVIQADRVGDPASQGRPGMQLQSAGPNATKEAELNGKAGNVGEKPAGHKSQHVDTTRPERKARSRSRSRQEEARARKRSRSSSRSRSPARRRRSRSRSKGLSRPAARSSRSRSRSKTRGVAGRRTAHSQDRNAGRLGSRDGSRGRRKDSRRETSRSPDRKSKADWRSRSRSRKRRSRSRRRARSRSRERSISRTRQSDRRGRRERNSSREREREKESRGHRKEGKTGKKHSRKKHRASSSDSSVESANDSSPDRKSGSKRDKSSKDKKAKS